MFDFEDWFRTYWNTYKGARDLFHGQQGGKDGPWKTKFKNNLKSPKLYERFNGEGTLEDNCREALERLRADIKAKRIQRDQGLPKTAWHLPMFSVYVGDNDKRYLWDIVSVSESHKEKSTPYQLPKGYDKKWADKAEEYCVGLGLYIRGVTPKGEAKRNMAKFMSEKLGKRVLPYLSNYIK